MPEGQAEIFLYMLLWAVQLALVFIHIGAVVFLRSFRFMWLFSVVALTVSWAMSNLVVAAVGPVPAMKQQIVIALNLAGWLAGVGIFLVGTFLLIFGKGLVFDNHSRH